LRGTLFRSTDITQSIDLGYDVVTTDEMFEMGWAALTQRIIARTAGRPTFITFDMDFVDPAAAPAVETPEAGGPSARETLLLLRSLKDINLIGCDVTEISPVYDGPGQITSLLGATVLSEFLALLASERKKATG
jgi:agmatinase